VKATRAVLFDLDDTLFDHSYCASAALAGVRRMHECFASVDENEFERRHGEILEVLHLEVLSKRIDLDAARVERFRRLYRASGLEPDDELAVQAAGTYRQVYIASRREVAGAAALLRAVRTHARVAVVSNNLLQEQQEKLRDCGLDRYVDVLVVSEEVGVAKPDPRIFEVALGRAGCRADEAVMVGDSWTNDIEGARAAGIRAVWFSRTGVPRREPGVDVIASLEPADEILKTILGRGPAAHLPRGDTAKPTR
jgi:putative hydrolase of the HAD superfamily